MSLIKYGLQPALIVGVLALWYFNPSAWWLFPLVVFGVQILLGVLEYIYPARPEWVHTARYKVLLVSVFVAMAMFSGVVVEPIYAETVNPFLTDLRIQLGIDIWPTSWPLIAQVLLAFFMSEFIWYWFHRAEHRWQWFWRLSGHGAHHAFKNLSALNAGANHPLELLLVLSIPSAIVELVFGAGSVVYGSFLLLLTQAYIAHANLDLNTKVIGWLFTTNRYHIHHHSAVFEESNTNFGCAAIVWDRLFGTFRDAYTEDTGTGPTQPSMWQLFIMPYREPVDTQTSPQSGGGASISNS